MKTEKDTLLVGADKVLWVTHSTLFDGIIEVGSIESVRALASSCAVEKIPKGVTVPAGITWKGSRMPKDLFAQIAGTVKEFPHRETGYVLMYRLRDNTWHVECPEQHGSGGSIHIEAYPVKDGYAAIGTLHTHPGMCAQWSGQDRKTQTDGNIGLYLLLGLRNGDIAETRAAIFTPYGYCDFPIEDVVELGGEPVANKDWIANINAPFPQGPGTFPEFLQGLGEFIKTVAKSKKVSCISLLDYYQILADDSSGKFPRGPAGSAELADFAFESMSEEEQQVAFLLDGSDLDVDEIVNLLKPLADKERLCAIELGRTLPEPPSTGFRRRSGRSATYSEFPFEEAYDA